MTGAWWLVALIAAIVPARTPAWANPERRSLPAPARSGGAPLADTLATRRSVRSFAGRELTDPELAQLLWAAQGASDGHRTAPSAGALYPLTVWMVDGRGVWRYLTGAHALERQRTGDRRATLARAAFDQEGVAEAPVIFVITGELAITARKYGRRAEQYVMLEAGHAAQNLLLTAVALGLGAVPVGAFEDRWVRAALELPGDARPIYVIPVGVPG